MMITKNKLVCIAALVMLAVSGPVFAATVFEDGFSADNTDGRWTELENPTASWGINTDDGLLYGNDFLLRQMSGYTIAAGNVATLTVESPRAWAGYPYKYDLVAFDGAVTYTTIVSFDGDLSGSPEEVFSVVDISAYAGQELGLNLGCGLNWGEIDSVQLDVVSLNKAVLVSPLDGAEYVPVDANLVWGPPTITPNYYDLYFGTDPNENNPTWYGNQKKLNKQNQTEYNPLGNMPNLTPHYWRVDAYEPNTVGEILRVGNMWSFTTISALPMIQTEPQSVTVAAGDEAVFTVGGLNLLTKEWYKDNVIITGETSGTLTISNVQLGNEGVYHCIVGNGDGAFDISTEKARLLTNRLMAHWKFEGDLIDEVESIVGEYTDPNAANPKPTPTYDPNYVEGAQSFRFGPEPYFIRADLADYFNFYPQGYTVSAWIKTIQTSPWGAYVSKQGSDPQSGFILTHDDSGQAVHTLRQSFSDLNSGVQIDDGKWHLVVGSYDAATGEGKVYVDGALANQATNAGVPETNTGPLIFGAELTTGSIPYIGLLDEVRIYSHPVDPYVIANEYVVIVPDAVICVDPTTDIEYDFDEDCDIDLADFAGYFIQQWLNCNRVAGISSGLLDCK